MFASHDGLQAILFDLDGTLLDTAPDLTAAINYARQQLLQLPPLPTQIVRPQVTRGTRALTALGCGIDAADIDEKNELFVSFRDQMLGYYLEHVADLSRPFQGIESLLEYLDSNEIPWGIVTNKPTKFARPLVDLAGLAKRARCLICGDTAARAKPHPDPLLLAAKTLQTSARQCAYVGDGLADMQASRAAGMFSIAAAYGYLHDGENVSDWPADMIVANANEILAWITR